MSEKELPGISKRSHGLSVSVKIYILIIAIILTVSAALVFTGYRTYSKNVDEAYYNRTRNAVSAGADFIPVDFLNHFWLAVQSEEFRRVKEEAIEVNDEEILVQWMRRQPGLYSDILTEKQLSEDPELGQYTTLYDEYDMLNLLCEQIRDTFDVADAYVQKMENGVTYTVIDPKEGLFQIGVIEQPLKEFEKYGDNEYVPPTIYRSRYGWLCTSCQPISLEKQVFGLFCVDIDMNEVIKQQNWFLTNSLIFVLLEIVAAIVISMVLIRRSITLPLVMLTNATRGFADSDENLSGEDVIDLPITSNDEIGTLYREIQSMQRRIVDYTEHITQITAEKEHTRTEMSLAARIQNSALPKNFTLPTAKVDLYALMDPAREVSGDFYDFFFCGEDRLCLVIADVSGKGIPASLFMMRAKTAIKYSACGGLGPAELLKFVNGNLCEENDTNMFVTVWLGMLDLKTGMMRCCNAGHEYPAVMRAGGGYELLKDQHGMMLGVFEDNSLTEYEIRMNPGDRIFVYTDGIPEAENEKKEQYGTDRLLQQLNRQKDADQKTVLEGLLQDIRKFTGAVEQFDDITMLGLTYKGDGE